jgi:hypothetical protein
MEDRRRGEFAARTAGEQRIGIDVAETQPSSGVFEMALLSHFDGDDSTRVPAPLSPQLHRIYKPVSE